MQAVMNAFVFLVPQVSIAKLTSMNVIVARARTATATIRSVVIFVIVSKDLKESIAKLISMSVISINLALMVHVLMGEMIMYVIVMEDGAARIVPLS